MLLKKKIEGKKKWKFESRKENQLSSNTLVPGSSTYLNKAEIVGYIWPTLQFVWEALIFSSMNQQTTQIKQIIQLSQYKAYMSRKVVKEAFHCHLLLFQDNKLDVIARVNEEILPACQSLKSTTVLLGYHIVSPPRNKLYPMAPQL